jgi:hypothetical protein
VLYTYNLGVALAATGGETHLTLLQGPVAKSHVSHLNQHTKK